MTSSDKMKRIFKEIRFLQDAKNFDFSAYVFIFSTHPFFLYKEKVFYILYYKNIYIVLFKHGKQKKNYVQSV